MLSIKQKNLLKIISDNTNASGSALLSAEIISALTSKPTKLRVDEIDDYINSLAFGGFIEVINTFKKEEPFYCITLTERGKNYSLVYKEDVKVIKTKLILAVVGAVVSFIIGRILYLLFS